MKSPASVTEAIAVSVRAKRNIRLLKRLIRSDAAELVSTGNGATPVTRSHLWRQFLLTCAHMRGGQLTILFLRELADVRGPRNVQPGCRHSDISLHFLMQRRAEVGAVEGINSRRLWYPLQRSGLARRECHARSSRTEDGEAMSDVPVLLDVGDVEVHCVTELDTFQVVRREVTADRYHLHVDLG